MRFRKMAKAATPMDALVGSRLRSRRKQLRISQERLGKEIGVSFQQVQKYENGTNRIGAGRLAEISKVLDVPVAYFFTGSSGSAAADGDRADAKAILSEPGATELLQAYAQIGSLALRNAVVRLARDLAGNYGDGTRMPPKRAAARHAAASKASP
jgi:transcriptional regulator with XRE-family HTH domain